MSKHTEGPWEFHVNEYHDGNKTFWVGNGEYVVFDCSTYSCKEMFFPPNLANARLICAAPDMLEALEELLQYAIQTEHFEHNSYNPPAEIHEMMANGDFSKRIYNAIAAIAKAKGEQP